MRKRGIASPLLVRSPEILRGRIVELNESFRRAVGEYGYKCTAKGVNRSTFSRPPPHRFSPRTIAFATPPAPAGPPTLEVSLPKLAAENAYSPADQKP